MQMQYFDLGIFGGTANLQMESGAAMELPDAC